MKRSTILLVASAVAAANAQQNAGTVLNGIPTPIGFVTGSSNINLPGLLVGGSANAAAASANPVGTINNSLTDSALMPGRISNAVTSASQNMQDAIRNPSAAMNNMGNNIASAPGAMLGNALQGGVSGANDLAAIARNPTNIVNLYADTVTNTTANNMLGLKNTANVTWGYVTNPLLLVNDTGRVLTTGITAGVDGINASDGMMRNVGQQVIDIGRLGSSVIPAQMFNATVDVLTNPMGAANSTANMAGGFLSSSLGGIGGAAGGFVNALRNAFSAPVRTMQTMQLGGPALTNNVASPMPGNVAGNVPGMAPSTVPTNVPTNVPVNVPGTVPTGAPVTAAIGVAPPNNGAGPDSGVAPGRAGNNEAPLIPSHVTPNSDGSTTATCSEGYKACLVGVAESMQLLCYNPNVFQCIPHAVMQNVVCPVQATGVCGLNCYNGALMRCVEGVLTSL